MTNERGTIRAGVTAHDPGAAGNWQRDRATDDGGVLARAETFTVTYCAGSFTPPKGGLCRMCHTRIPAVIVVTATHGVLPLVAPHKPWGIEMIQTDREATP